MLPQWNIPSWFIAPMKMAWFYEILFFEVVLKKVKYSIKDAMPVNISCIYYREWRKVIFSVVLGEFEIVYIFCCFFLFTIVVSVGKRLP